MFTQEFLEDSALLTAEQNILIGNRIPKDYFITTGVGESDITVHAGSYHLALKQAGIEMANIMTYSSILPNIATLIEKPNPRDIRHGCVMESIMSVCNVEQGQRASAGIIYGWLRDRNTGQKYGGLVCEHEGSYTRGHLEELLYASLNELYVNGFDDEFTLGEINLITESFVPKKKYGTALVSLCFTNYLYPIIKG